MSRRKGSRPHERVTYRDLGADHFDRLAVERLTRHYLRRLEQLGHVVTLDPAPARA